MSHFSGQRALLGGLLDDVLVHGQALVGGGEGGRRAAGMRKKLTKVRATLFGSASANVLVQGHSPVGGGGGGGEGASR